MTGEARAAGPELGAKVLAEAIGSFALVFVGCGAIMVDASSGGVLSHVGVALSFGLVIMVMIYATGHISGAHFNPAVTVAFACAGRFRWSEVPAYVAGQILAAIAAALVLRATLGDVADLGATTPSVPWMPALVFEGILSFFLMFVISAVATDGRAVGQLAGVAIGGTVALAALMGGPVSGASLNPARSLGPALVAGLAAQQWLYLLGPVAGAVAGALAYGRIRCGGDEVDAAGCC